MAHGSSNVYADTEATALFQQYRHDWIASTIFNDMEIIQYRSLYQLAIIPTEAMSAIEQFLEGQLLADCRLMPNHWSTR